MKSAHRAWIYGVGMLVLALGLELNVKTGLGASPILSLAYSASLIWGISFGDTTLALYAIFVAAQLVIRGKDRQWYDLLQLPFSLVFSRLLNLYGKWIPYDPAQAGLAMNLVVLLAAIFITGTGVAMTVNMRLIPNPGDGIVQAVADRMGRDQGFAKNVFDIGCVLTTVVFSLALSGQILGVGVGTLLAMVGVGRSIALVNYLFKDRMCRAAGVSR